MAQINLFRSSACDENGTSLIKAVVVLEEAEELGPDFGENMSAWLRDPGLNVMVLAGGPHVVRWLN